MDLERVRGRLFKPGARFHINSSDGQGLGLFMTKRQIELMGGSLELFSKPDKGTTFKLIFNRP
jgi:signal transduction histidine kinase